MAREAGSEEREFTPEEVSAVSELLQEVMLGNLTLGDVQGVKPEQLEAVYALAHRHYVQGEDAKAERLFSWLCRMEHLEARFWLGLGGVRQRLGKHAQAVKAYAACAMLDPESPVPGLFAAESFLALGDLENAESGLAAAMFWAGDKPEHAAVRDRAGALARALERRRNGGGGRAGAPARPNV